MATMKRCYKCKTEKPDSDFLNNRAKKSGLQDWCRPCHVGHQAKYNKMYTAQYPTISYAHNKLRYLISIGIEKPATEKKCAACGRQADQHHFDHYIEFKFRPLCVTCHVEWHKHNVPGGRNHPQTEMFPVTIYLANQSIEN